MGLEKRRIVSHSGACLRNIVVVIAILAAIAGLVWLFYAFAGVNIYINDHYFAIRSHAFEQKHLQKYFQSLFPGDSVNTAPGFPVLGKTDGSVSLENTYGVR